MRQRAVRLYRESDPKPVIRRLAEQLGMHHEALRNWIRQAEADAGERDDRPTTEMAEENRRLRRKTAELSLDVVDVQAVKQQLGRRRRPRPARRTGLGAGAALSPVPKRIPLSTLASSPVRTWHRQAAGRSSSASS
jgi:transposase-like protein